MSQIADGLATGAQELYQRSDQLEKKADALRHSAHQSRKKVKSLHGASADEGGPEIDEIVTQDGKRQEHEKLFPIVGIGASAGGYEAFADFLRHLPKDTGMALVMIQHLDPKHKSQLGELLQHASKIPVLQAENEMEVQPDRIYVIPENVSMTIADGKLRLHPRKEHEAPPMPIDMFFRSLAEDHQSKAIGVVLSGTGCDGTLGIEAIKGEGGITFAQDDHTSKFYGMPGSAIATGAVDFILPPGKIAEELGRVAKHPLVSHGPRPGPPAEAAELQRLLRENPNDIASLFRLLRARTGVDFSLYKQSTLKRRIIRRMILHKKEMLGQYLKLVESSPVELDALFNDMLINVTSFFRDPQTFKVLKKKVFPKLLKAHTGDAPCGSGSVAALLVRRLTRWPCAWLNFSTRPAPITRRRFLPRTLARRALSGRGRGFTRLISSRMSPPNGCDVSLAA
jgi:two-component system CheB/CheR fusion protein